MTMHLQKAAKMASDILQATHICADLHQSDADLVYAAMNTNLTEYGVEQLEELHALIEDGTYDLETRQKQIYKTISALSKHRVAMKRALRKIGCPFDNGDTTPHLEDLVRFNNLEVV